MVNSEDDPIHVGFDVDGVLRDYPTYLLKCFKEDHPEYARFFRSAEEMVDWNFRKNMVVYNDDVCKFFYRYAFGNEETGFRIYRNAEPYPYVRNFSKSYDILNRMGARVSICTSQPTKWQQLATLEWLTEHNISYDSLIFCGDNKSNFGLDYLIDDHIKNVVSIDSTGGVGVLFERPYNTNKLNRVKYHVDSIDDYVSLVVKQEMDLA